MDEINWDHTGIYYVPMSSWPMEAPGTKQVEIIGKDDKWQLKAVLGCSMSGHLLTPQLIYQDKEKYWANENTKHQ